MINSFKGLFTNPFSRESTIPNFSKQAIVFSELLSLKVILKKSVSILFIAIFAIFYLKLPINIIIILLIPEFLFILISGFLKIKKMKSVLGIDTSTNSKGYREILIKNQYFNLIQSIFGTIITIISTTIILTFFSHQIPKLVSSSFITQENFLRYIIILFVSYKVFNLFLKFIHYNLVKKVRETNDFAQINQDYFIATKKIGLIEQLIVMSAFISIFYIIGIPHTILLVFLGFLALLSIASISEIQRIKSVNLDTVEVKSDNSYSIASDIYKDEEILLTIYGILRTAVDFKSVFNPFGSSILGKGKINNPENTLILTNKRLLFIQIPMPGGDNIVGNHDFVTQNFFYNKKALIEEGEALLKTQSLNQLLKLVKVDVKYSDIKNVVIKQNQLIIEKITNESFGYFFMDKEYVNNIKQTLKEYLDEKQVIHKSSN